MKSVRGNALRAALALFVVSAGAIAVVAQEEQCRCTKVENRECSLVQLVSAGLVDECRVVDVPCGQCACDDEGDLLCEYDTAVVYEFVEPFPVCTQTLEVRIAVCPEPAPPTLTPTPTAPASATPTAAPTPPLESREFTCATDQRLRWIPPLTCTIEADDFPANAIISGASIVIVEYANGTALFRNMKDTPANGSYVAEIFQNIESSPSAGLFGDWPDIDTGTNPVNMDPQTTTTEFVSFGPVPFTVPASQNFSTVAQSVLIESQTDIVLTLSADNLFTTSNDFTGSRLVSAFAKVDVTISVFFTLPFPDQQSPP